MMAQDALAALPESWRRALRHFAIEPIGRGMSDANLFRLRDDARGERLYLKIYRGEAALAELRNEVERTKWLAAHDIMVPRFLRLCEDSLLAAGLMTALPGRHPQHADMPLPELMRRLAEGLRKLHSLSARDCPFDETVGARLARARAAIAEGLVNPEYFSERNQGLAPQTIYTRLIGAVPTHEDIVVVHGDATFDNLLIDDAANVGFIDCGHAGRGDRYFDLATIIADIDTHFGPDCIPLFERSYGHAAFDGRKLEFFNDLYELF
jgi:aminoglycoside phosphotransferase